MRLHALYGKEKAELVPLLTPQISYNNLAAQMEEDLCAGSLMSAEHCLPRSEIHAPKDTAIHLCPDE